MMYPFLQLEDGTEIVHSDMQPDGSVKVYIEKPDAAVCFRSATCYLPAYRWAAVDGVTDTEIAEYQKILESVAHLILDFSRDGGFEHAAGF